MTCAHPPEGLRSSGCRASLPALTPGTPTPGAHVEKAVKDAKPHCWFVFSYGSVQE